MDIREMVDSINRAPTMLVKVNLGEGGTHDMMVVRPASYHEEGWATVHIYRGPRVPEGCAGRGEGEERVVDSAITGPLPGSTIRGATVNSVTPYETDLDTMPLRDLPLWAKEMWVMQTELHMESNLSGDRNAYAKVNAMRRLIEQERRGGGLDPDMMNADMRGRYLRLWYSMDALDRECSSGLDDDALRAMKRHLETVMDVVPGIMELPWRNQEGLDPESWFNREDVYEAMTDVMHEAALSLIRLITKLMGDMQTGEKDG